MPSKFFAILAISFFSANFSFAADTATSDAHFLTVHCTNGEALNLTLKQVTNSTYNLSVVMQSTGDSYPEFHFRNLVEAPMRQGIVGAPELFYNKDVSLSINFTTLKAAATLTIPSLGLQDEPLTCR